MPYLKRERSKVYELLIVLNGIEIWESPNSSTWNLLLIVLNGIEMISI